MKLTNFFLFFILSSLLSCSGLEKAEKKRERKRNLLTSPIQRQCDEDFFSLKAPVQVVRKSYPWERRYVGTHLRITKEFFRCKGIPTHPPLPIERRAALEYHLDCGGVEGHTLPMREGKEFIYPLFINLLNALQEKFDKAVIITCGHRCPAHNLYAAPFSKAAQTSKHLIGAEVDFYVEGMEQRGEEVVEALLCYFDESFARSTHFTQVRTPSWYNQEVAITLFEADEGRDLDNNHPYPYISIQLLFDKEKGQPVRYNWHRAHTGFLTR